MRAAVIAVLVTVTGCEKADESQSRSAQPPIAAASTRTPRAPDAPAVSRVAAPAPRRTSPAPAEGRPLDDLRFTVPSGWTVELDGSGQWNFESRGVTARLNRAPEGVPTTASGYLEYKVDWCWDPGATAELVTIDSRPDGFAATMLVRDPEDPDHPRTAYHAIWDLDGVRLRCEADRVPDDATRDQIAALCDSARW